LYVMCLTAVWSVSLRPNHPKPAQFFLLWFKRFITPTQRNRSSLVRVCLMVLPV
jgi:hypothetical protein